MEESLLEEEKCIKDKKKFCIILLFVSNILFLSIIIILILISINNGKNEDDKNENKKESSEIYSFTAIYNTIIDNQTSYLIKKLPHKGLKTCNITKMIIDNNEEVTPSLEYTFPFAGKFLDRYNRM